MRRLLSLAFLLVGCAVPALAQPTDGGVIVRSSLLPESGAVVGQHIRVFVDVLFYGQMPRPPRVALPEVAGAQVMRIESQATTMRDTIDGKTYTGQRFEFALYPRRGGRIVVPPATVALLDTAGNETGTVSGQRLQAEVAVPAGVDLSGPVIATTRATLEEQWKPMPTTAFRAGDASVRMITREAADVPAMAMRDLVFTAPPGVRVYVDPPQSEDRQNRGDLVGRRVDRVTYVFEQGGSFEIPGVEQPWWDLGSKRLRSTQRPAVTVAVSAAPAATKRDWGEPMAWLTPGLAALGVLALIWLSRSGWPWLRDALAGRQARWLASEPKAFRDLLAACRKEDIASIHRTFTVWRRRVPNRSSLAPLTEELELALFGTPVPAAWPPERGRAFADKLQVARRSLKDRHRPEAHASRALPPLNPAS